MSAWKVAGVLVILVAMGAGSWYVLDRQHERRGASSGSQPASSVRSSRSAGDEPPLRIKHLGIELGPYDAATGKAGDLVFHKDNLEYNVIFMPFGWQVPANDVGPAKANPQPTFVAPIGTPVRSIVDGVVVDIPTLYSGDVSIQISDKKQSNWLYETEHVMNPTVKVGDRVTAGQVIAEVSDYTAQSMPGYGYFEIGILQGGNPPQHICPFAYLDPSAKTELESQLTQLYSDWEGYIGDTSLYNEAESPLGCVSLEAVEG